MTLWGDSRWSLDLSLRPGGQLAEDQNCEPKQQFFQHSAAPVVYHLPYSVQAFNDIT